MKHNVEEVLERIKFAMMKKGVNQRQLAEAIGITAPAVNKWFIKGNIPSLGGNLEKLAIALDTTPAYILFGENETIDRSIKLEDGYVIIPNLDVEASCGSGIDNGQEKPLVKFLKVSTEWLRVHAPFANYSSLNVIVASGDSMIPTIKSGDMVLVDTSANTIKTDAIYVFVRNGELFLKRIQRIANGLRIISDNHIYPPFEINGDDLNGLKIVGRVCCLGNFLEV